MRGLETNLLPFSLLHSTDRSSATIEILAHSGGIARDSFERLPQRQPSADREGAALSRPGWADLRLGNLYHGAHLARRSVCLRAPLAPPGERRRHYEAPVVLHGGQGARRSG